MRRSRFEEDLKFGQKFMPTVIQILPAYCPPTIIIAPERWDREEGTDLCWIPAGEKKIAVRIRRPNTYPWGEFTLRCDSHHWGNECEKILDRGSVDLYFYGHAVDEHSTAIRAAIIVNMHMLAMLYHLRKHNLTGNQIPRFKSNNDGTFFLIFNIGPFHEALIARWMPADTLPLFDERKLSGEDSEERQRVRPGRNNAIYQPDRGAIPRA